MTSIFFIFNRRLSQFFMLEGNLNFPLICYFLVGQPAQLDLSLAQLSPCLSTIFFKQPPYSPLFQHNSLLYSPFSKLNNPVMSTEIECVNLRIKYSLSKSEANTKFYQSSTDFIFYKTFFINYIKIPLPYFVADSVFLRQPPIQPPNIVNKHLDNPLLVILQAFLLIGG